MSCLVVGASECYIYRSKMSAKFQILRGVNGNYRFNLIAPNGQIILSSDQYDNKTGAQDGIRSLRSNARYDSRFERRITSNGEPYFVLKAFNGEIIGRSDSYSSKAGMENGIQAVKSHAPVARVVDFS
jgi:uncharacterized protein